MTKSKNIPGITSSLFVKILAMKDLGNFPSTSLASSIVDNEQTKL